METSTHTQGTTMSGVSLTKVTDVKIAYGWMILHGTIIECHDTWFQVKIQMVTDSVGGTKLRDSWMVGREMPFAIADRVLDDQCAWTPEACHRTVWGQSGRCLDHPTN